MTYAQGFRGAEKRKASVPVAFDVDPAARTLLPAARNPRRPGARPFDIVAFHPDVLMAVPPPVAGLPVHDLEPLGRQDGNDFDSRRARGRRQLDLGAELR